MISFEKQERIYIEFLQLEDQIAEIEKRQHQLINDGAINNMSAIDRANIRAKYYADKATRELKALQLIIERKGTLSFYKGDMPLPNEPTDESKLLWTYDLGTQTKTPMK